MPEKMDSKWPKADSLLKQFARFGRSRGPLVGGRCLESRRGTSLRESGIRIQYDAMNLARFGVESKA